jgi:hypothetical protein
MTMLDTPEATDIAVKQAERIDELEQRLRALEKTSARATAPVAAGVPTETERSDRRRFLKLAGVAAAGIVGAQAIRPEAAAAADGGALVLGASNVSTADTILSSTSSVGSVILDCNAGAAVPSTSFRDGVYGTGNANSIAYGVLGFAATGIGVRGSSNSGYALYAAGNGRLGIGSHATNVPVPANTYSVGDIIRDASGNMVVCVASGTPGTFRRIAGPGTAGQIHFLPSPVRAYDSVLSGQGPLSGGPRTVNLSTGILAGNPPAVPVGAVAAIITVIAYNTFAGGYLTAYSAAVATVPVFTTLLWSASNLFVTATSFSLVSSQQVKVYVYPGAQTDFQIDVIGYTM